MKILFSTERLLVREFEWSDWESVHAYAQLPEVSQYQYWGPNTVSETKTFVKQALAYQTHSPRHHYEWCICLKDGRHIGGCGVFVDPARNKEGQIGYIFHPDYWRQGFATEVVAQMVPYCQKHLQLEVIGATCDTRNIASRRVLEKNGFKISELKENDYLQKGTWRHTYRFLYVPEQAAQPSQAQARNVPR